MRRCALLAALVCTLLAPATGGTLAWERCQARVVAAAAREPAAPAPRPTPRTSAARRPVPLHQAVLRPAPSFDQPAVASAPRRVTRLFLMHRSLLR